MIHIIGEKAFLLRTIPPVVGRKIMMQGDGVRGIVEGSVADKLTVLSFVSVRVGADNWIPLSTTTMLDNHVPEADDVDDLLYAVLEHNCCAVHDVIDSPTVADIFWLALDELVDEVITQCS